MSLDHLYRDLARGRTRGLSRLRSDIIVPPLPDADPQNLILPPVINDASVFFNSESQWASLPLDTPSTSGMLDTAFAATSSTNAIHRARLSFTDFGGHRCLLQQIGARAFGGNPGGSQVIATYGVKRPRVFITYASYIPRGFTFVAAAKFGWSVWGGPDLNTGGNDATGDGWVCRMETGGPNDQGCYWEHAGQKTYAKDSKSITTTFGNPFSNAGNSFYYLRGAWTLHQTEIVMNDLGVDNGILRQWTAQEVNPGSGDWVWKQQDEWTDRRWLVSGGTGQNRLVDGLYYAFFFGGTGRQHRSAQAQSLYTTAVIQSTQPIFEVAA